MLIALGVIGIILSPVFMTQKRMLSRVLQEVAAVQRFFSAQEYLYQKEKNRLTRKSEAKKNLNVMKNVQLTYKEKKIAKGSALAPYENIVLEVVHMRWKDGYDWKTEEIVQLYYKNPADQEEEST